MTSVLKGLSYIVEDKRNGDAGVVGPLTVVRFQAEAFEVPRELILFLDVYHCILLSDLVLRCNGEFMRAVL